MEHVDGTQCEAPVWLCLPSQRGHEVSVIVASHTHGGGLRPKDSSLSRLSGGAVPSTVQHAHKFSASGTAHRTARPSRCCLCTLPGAELVLSPSGQSPVYCGAVAEHKSRICEPDLPPGGTRTGKAGEMPRRHCPLASRGAASPPDAQHQHMTPKHCPLLSAAMGDQQMAIAQVPKLATGRRSAVAEAVSEGSLRGVVRQGGGIPPRRHRSPWSSAA